MPPAKVLCANCETEELSEVGEDYYQCSAASESERETRTGCGTLISFKEYKARQSNASTSAKKAPSAAVRSTPASSASKLPLRRPLASLHSNALHNRTPLHGRAAAAAPPPAPVVQLTPPCAPAAPTPSSGSSSSSAASPKATPSRAQPPSDSEDDSSDSGGEDTPAKPATKGPTRRKNASKAASSSPAASPAKSFNLADPAVSSSERMRLLRAKLAKQREKSLADFREKYGDEGDQETEEERALAARKQAGEAEEDFMNSQGEGVQIARAPMVASLSIKGAENPLAGSMRRPFTTPRAHGVMSSEAKKLIAERQKSLPVGRRLGARLRVFNGSFNSFKPLDEPPVEEESTEPPPPPPPPVALSKADEAKAKPDGFQPLVIWAPTAEELASNPSLTSIEVPMVVCKWLRPHQREGVRFMCECVLGQRNLIPPETPPPPPQTTVNEDGTVTVTSAPPPSPPPPQPSYSTMGGGAILADDMGLGKTLQSVALLYTLLTQGFETGQPVARKVVIVTPTSLVSNWANEIEKWLGKGKVNVVALSEVGKDNISCGIDSFVGRGSKAHVLIVSYDTFRRQVERLNKPGLCDLLICDEAHRLKNNKTSTYTALDSLPCRRRVLLSGTPMQNDLSEFFSMINFTNRNILGDRRCFRKYYELPILLGREPDCLERDAEEGSERAAELSAIVNTFVLRRTNVLLRAHLPPKVIEVVCCRPSELQVKLYRHLLSSKSVKKLTGEAEEGGGSRGGLQALPLITSLKKLCNHPKLIWDTAQAAGDAKKRGKGGLTITNEEGVAEKVPPALLNLFKGLAPIFHQHDGGSFLRNTSDAKYSGKMFVLERLLAQVRAANTGERFVIVSNFTSALDVIASMCAARRWDCLRLDGTTSIKNRQKLVDQLSDRTNKVFVFLLSSRAGGCGLNLIGANRLVLFDPDWNPAVDKQAAARVWRDGQTKRCFVYRFLTTGSIEEKVYQRQLSKEGLSGVLGGSTADASLTKEELRDLFTLDEKALEQPSDTHKSLECECLDPFLIRTEDEAARAEEEQKRNAEEHVKRLALEEAAAAEASRNQMDDTEEGAEEAKDNGQTSPLDTPSTALTDGDTMMEDANAEAEPGAPVGEPAAAMDEDGEGEEGGGGGDGDDSSSDGDDDGDMGDFIEKDSGDDDSGDEGYGSKKKTASKAKAKKPNKKDGPRKQRKKRAVVGSLNFPALHSLHQYTLGQRGEPPEEELINWAHHATSNSIPDPLFRLAAKGMPFTRGQLPFVSFVFSCEVTGKEILNSTDTADAAAVSSRCATAPTSVQASKPIAVSLEAAKAKHAEFMRVEAARKKRSGADELEERLADPSKRRHSTRNSGPKRNDQEDPDLDEDDFDFDADDAEPGSSTNSRKRKSGSESAPASDMDDATAALIRQLQEEDAGLVRKKKPGRPAKAKKPPPPPVEEEPLMDDDVTPPPSPTRAPLHAPSLAPPPAPARDDGATSDESSMQAMKKRRTEGVAASPIKPKVTPASPASKPSPARKPSSPVKKLPSPMKQAAPRAASVQASSSSDSDIEIIDVAPSKAKHPPTHSPAIAPAKRPPPPQIREEEDDDDFLE